MELAKRLSIKDLSRTINPLAHGPYVVEPRPNSTPAPFEPWNAQDYDKNKLLTNHQDYKFPSAGQRVIRNSIAKDPDQDAPIILQDVEEVIKRNASRFPFLGSARKRVIAGSAGVGALAAVLGGIAGCDATLQDPWATRSIERCNSDDKWGDPFPGKAPGEYTLDQFAGRPEIPVRTLVTDCQKDVIGYIMPGERVRVSWVMGPVYHIDGGDADNLPKVVIDGETYMPWAAMLENKPIMEKIGEYELRPKIGEDGNQEVRKGFLRGSNPTK